MDPPPPPAPIHTLIYKRRRAYEILGYAFIDCASIIFSLFLKCSTASIIRIFWSLSEHFWVLTGMLIPKCQWYADVLRYIFLFCFSFFFLWYLQFTEPRNGGLGLGCTGTGSPMVNHVGPNTSYRQGYKMVSAMPADSSETLQLSQRNDGPGPATISRDLYIL